MKILLIDFHDSYTYNVYDLLVQLTSSTSQITVWSHDDSSRKIQNVTEFDAIVLSPGPGNPTDLLRDGAKSMARSVLDMATRHAMPLFGVCLGHQLLCEYRGAKVERVEPAHGKVSRVVVLSNDTKKQNIFEGCPKEFHVVRYHSLAAKAVPLESKLRVTCALGGDGGDEEKMIMAVEASDVPHFGVQFHPESVLSQHGALLFTNFLRICCVTTTTKSPRKDVLTHQPHYDKSSSSPSSQRLYVRKIKNIPASFSVKHFFRNAIMCSERKTSFWLDNAMAERQTRLGLPITTEFGGGAFSFLGGGRLQIVDEEENNDDSEHSIRYDVTTRTMFTHYIDSNRVEKRVLKDRESFLKILDKRLDSYRSDRHVDIVLDGKITSSKMNLPFDFTCGYVGFLGYELKAETLGTGFRSQKKQSARKRKSPADAYWYFARQCVAIDHQSSEVYVMSLNRRITKSNEEIWEWLKRFGTTEFSETTTTKKDRLVKSLQPHYEKKTYESRVSDCQRSLRAGDSYVVFVCISLKC